MQIQKCISPQFSFVILNNNCCCPERRPSGASQRIRPENADPTHTIISIIATMALAYSFGFIGRFSDILSPSKIKHIIPIILAGTSNWKLLIQVQQQQPVEVPGFCGY
jgi:hypothetical protein